MNYCYLADGIMMLEMSKKNPHILLALVVLSVCFTCIWGMRYEGDKSARVRIIRGFDYDSTFFLVDGVSGELIYDAGHNMLKLDTIIAGNHVFIENISTEECSDRIVVCNPDDSLLMRAYNLGWCFGLDEREWEILVKGTDKPFRVESLDIENRRVSVRFFNDSTAVLDLYGEICGNYYVECRVDQTDVVADTVRISPEEEILVMNNSIRMEICYKGHTILEKTIWPDSFKGIDAPETYILAPTGKVWFEVENDVLVASTGMYMFDTDCGYDIEIRVSSDGKVKMMHIVSEQFLAFSDMIYDFKNQYEGERLSNLALTMDFYDEPSSSAQDYALLLAFCLYNTDASAWESVAWRLYETFVQYPEKLDELHMCLRVLNDTQRKRILAVLMELLSPEMYDRISGKI